MIRPRTARRLILRHIQALARPNLNSTESVEAVQHVGTYIRVVACSLDDVRGGVVHRHGNGSGRVGKLKPTSRPRKKPNRAKQYKDHPKQFEKSLHIFIFVHKCCQSSDAMTAPTSIAVYYSATHIIEGTSYDSDVISMVPTCCTASTLSVEFKFSACMWRRISLRAVRGRIKRLPPTRIEQSLSYS